MAKKNKLWFSGEDAQLAARFTKCLTKALYNRRASYLRAKAEQAASEISIEECSEEVDKMYTPTTRPVEEIVESKLMWESIRKYLHGGPYYNRGACRVCWIQIYLCSKLVQQQKDEGI